MERLAAIAAALLFFTGAASAATFTVDDPGSGLEQSIGNASCDGSPAPGNQCTLHAAIQNANKASDFDTIVFSGVTSITLTASLPQVTQRVLITGSLTDTPGQRVEINGNGTNGCFELNSAPGAGNTDDILAAANNTRLEHLVIRNCQGNGVSMSGHGYVVYDSYIGVLPNGSTASANSGSGISITAPAGENSISNALSGMTLPGDLNDIVSIAGFIATANLAPNGIIDNVISGNAVHGVDIFGEFSAASILFNNKIGTNAAGTAAIANGTAGGNGYGVFLAGSTYLNFIGLSNVIAGNNADDSSGGVEIATGNVPFPNFVLTNQIGVSAANPITNLGNDNFGVRVSDARPNVAADAGPGSNTIVNPLGISAVIGPGNIVGHNGDTDEVPTATDAASAPGGIIVFGANAEGVKIFGNIVGISEPTGAFIDIGNYGDGINVVGKNHLIGDDTLLFGNIVGKNRRHGIVVRGAAIGTGNVLKSNRIGTLPDLLEGADIGNAGLGLWIRASNTTVGGPSFASQRNVIAFNGSHAIRIDGGASSIGTLLQQNSIFGVPAGSLGIDLDQANNAPDPTDNVVPDRGPTQTDNDANWGQNTVVLTAAASGLPTWTLASGNSNPYRIDFYSSPGDGRGGKAWLCAANATTDATGNAAGTACGGTAGEFLTATVTDLGNTTGALPDVPGDVDTDPVNNTSEFSNGVVVPQEIRFQQPTYSVSESGGSLNVTVERTGTATASVDVVLTGGTAANGTDFAFTSPTQVTWALNDPPAKLVAIAITSDNLDELDETIVLDLENAVGGVESAPAQTTVTITDDDATPTLSVADVSLNEGTGGTTTAFDFTVALSAASGQTVAVTAASGNVGANQATAGVDYTAVGPLVVTFLPGETSKIVTAQVAHDADVEPNETFALNLTVPSNASITDGQAVGTIQNDDAAAPSFAINDVSTAEGNAGTTNLVFTVTRTVNTAGAASVQATTSDGTATIVDNDYAPFANQVVSFADGAATAQVTVVLNGDLKRESDETLTVTLSNASAGTISDATGAGTIQNDDAIPSITIADVALAEGNAATTPFVFVLTLSNPSDQAVTVNAATSDGTATILDNDYAAANAVVTFPAGTTSANFIVDVTGDTTDEPAPQDFAVNLSGATNGTIADPAAVGTIQNDDVPNAPSFAIGDSSIAEGNAGVTPATFTVTRSVNTTGTATVDYVVVDGTGTVADADFAAGSGTLTFVDSDATETVTVNVNGDAKFEANETYTVQLSNASAGTISDATGAGIITNDDNQPTVSIAPVALGEGNAGSTAFAFVVTLSNPSSQVVTAAVSTADASATVGNNDYAPLVLQPVTFAAGTTTQNATVNVTGDTTVETDETFDVTLQNPVNATIIGELQTVAGTIINDDSALPTLTIGDVTLAEGNAATTAFSFTITRAGDLSGASSVNVTTASGTADGTDFGAVNTTVNFAALEATQNVVVNVVGDTSVEPDETFFVNLTNATGALVSDNQAIGTITNDDAAVAPTLAINDVSLAEGNAGTTAFTFTVTRAGDLSQPSSVNVASANGSADATDFGALSTTVNFAAAAATAQATVNVIGDTTVEPNETFVVNLTGPVNGTITDGQGQGTIVNDDAAPNAPALSIDDVALAEGNAGTTAFTFTITRAGDLSLASSVDVATAIGTADGTDFTALTTTANFAASQATAQATVSVTGDTTVETNETFVVNLSNATNASLADAQGQGTIVNDDAATPSVFTIADVSQAEGNGASTITVTITRTPTTDAASVTVSTANGTATAGSDYTAIPPTVVNFAVGQGTATVVITIQGDAVIEGNETIFVNLSGAVNGTIGDGQAIVTITNDDAVVGGGDAPVPVPTSSRELLMLLAAILLLVGGLATRRTMRS